MALPKFYSKGCKYSHEKSKNTRYGDHERALWRNTLGIDDRFLDDFDAV